MNATKAIRKALGIAALSWGLSINLYLTIHLACRDCIPPVAQVNHIVHWPLLVSVGILITALLLRVPRSVGLWLFPGAAFFAIWFGPNWIPSSTPAAQGVEISAATFNVFGFAADPEQIFAVIESLETDFVGLQELRPLLQAKLRTELADRYPYQVTEVVQGFEGLGLLSRYPIVEHEIFIQTFEGIMIPDEPNFLRAVVDVEGQPIVVYVVHPATARFALLTAYDDCIIQSHVETLIAMLRDEHLPMLVLCDCNSSPRSRQFAVFDDLLDEAHQNSGQGFGLTYPAAHPLWRIDLVWYSEHFSPLTAQVWPASGTSDHRPFLACLDWRLN